MKASHEIYNMIIISIPRYIHLWEYFGKHFILSRTIFFKLTKITYKNNSEIPNQTFNKKDYVTHASLNIYI